MSEYTVICMKWGDKYGAEYVNRLYNMCKRNITLPFKFIAFTDKTDGLGQNIDARPLPEMDLPPDRERGWRKLSCFRDDIGLSGRILFLDLDTVIVSNIDDYFLIDGEFYVIEHWRPSKKHGIGETGVYRFEAGKNRDLYDYFMANMRKVKAEYRHEQAYVTDVLSKAGKLKFWPKKWMPSFKYNCMRPFPLCYFMDPILPPEAKMVVFHGNPTPDQAMAGVSKGIKGIFRHVRTPQWLKDNWR